jgi:hypothetical protein
VGKLSLAQRSNNEDGTARACVQFPSDVFGCAGQYGEGEYCGRTTLYPGGSFLPFHSFCYHLVYEKGLLVGLSVGNLPPNGMMVMLSVSSIPDAPVLDKLLVPGMALVYQRDREPYDATERE